MIRRHPSRLTSPVAPNQRRESYIERASRKTSSLVRIYLLPEVAAGLPDLASVVNCLTFTARTSSQAR